MAANDQREFYQYEIICRLPKHLHYGLEIIEDSGNL